MIQLSELAKLLQDTLNGVYNAAADKYANIVTFGLESFRKNTTFEFLVSADEANYKKGSFNGIIEKHYIQGILTAVTSDKAGVSAETYNAAISTKLELAIPFCDMEFTADSGEKIRFSEAVRYLIDSVLASTSEQYITGEDRMVYYVGVRYSISSTSVRDIRGMIGDSLILTVYINYSIVASGISSTDITLTIEDEIITPTRFGMARRSIQEGNISNTDSASKNTTTGTALTITFDTPVRLNACHRAAMNYIIDGTITTLNVTVKVPINFVVNDDETKPKVMKEGHYKMVFADAGLNGELNLAASASIRLIESW